MTLATPLATAFVRIRPDLRTFQRDTDEGVKKSGVDKTAEKHGKLFGSTFGKAAGAAIAAGGLFLAAKGIEIFGDIIKQGREAEKTNRLVAAAIKSTGGAANVTVKSVSDLADAIGRNAGVESSVVKSGSAMLLTFRNVRNETGKGNDIFNRANKALVDMTAALTGGNVTSEALRKQAIQLGKALNDPVKGLTALQRVGVSFTDQQKKQIAALVSSGHTLTAQKIILRELGKEFGGAAAASADPMQKLSVGIHEVEERLGTALLPVMNKFVGLASKQFIPALLKASDWFNRTGLPAIQHFAAAALPLATKVLGVFFTGLTTIIRAANGLPKPLKIAGIAVIALGVAMRLAAAANPWLLLATAIILVVGIIVKNWAKIKSFTVTVWRDILSVISGVWNWIKAHWPLLLAILTGPIGAAVIFIVRNWGKIQSAAATMINWVRNAWNTLVNKLRDLFAWFVNKFLGFVQTILNGAAKAFGWIPGIGGKLRSAATQFAQFRQNVNNALGGINGRTVKVGVAFAEAQGKHEGPSLAGFAEGGPVRGPGGPTADKIPALLSNKEFVVNAASHQQYGTRALSAVNRGTATIIPEGSVARFAGGGSVSTTPGVNVVPHVPSDSLIRKVIETPILSAALKFAESLLVSGGSAIVRYAAKFIGKVPYVWGGTAVPGGADCSGFVQTIYKHFGINAPRTSEAQGAWVRRSGPTPGGLAFYHSPAGGPDPGHVGIVAGNGKVISQGGGLGPQVEPLHFVPLLWTGVPPGGLGRGGGPGGGGGFISRGAAVSMGKAMAAGYGWTGLQWTDLFNLWQRESGWNDKARNSSSGAAGIPQDITGNFHGGARGQISWGLKYIKNRWRNPAEAWSHELRFGWYGDGGPINEPVVGVGLRTGRGYGFGENGPEDVVPAGAMGAVVSAIQNMHGDLLDVLADVPGATGAAFGHTLNGLGLAGTRARNYGARR